MQRSSANGNGAIPNKVLAWAIVAVSVVAAPVSMLWMQRAADEEHRREILDLRDRVHAATLDAMRERIAGQDEVLQREMRLLDAATRETIAGLKEAYKELHAFTASRAIFQADTVKGTP